MKGGLRLLGALGAWVLGRCHEVGGMTLLCAYVGWSLLRGRLDGRELLRNLYKMGVVSVPIVALTALFTGGIMVIQSGIFVRRFQAYGLLGWGSGFAVFREVGPILIGLMFSGRVGANNAAELGTMVVTEQIDALRVLAIDPVSFLVAPRTLAIVVAAHQKRHAREKQRCAGGDTRDEQVAPARAVAVLVPYRFGIGVGEQAAAVLPRLAQPPLQPARRGFLFGRAGGAP